MMLLEMLKTYHLNMLQDIQRMTAPSNQPEIWWDDAQYPEADLYLKWPCSANFYVFHGILKLSIIGLDLV